MNNKGRILCPSAMCEPGVKLLGIVGKDGRVSLLEEAILVDKTFASIAHQGRTPEKRFRFTTPCLKKACQQWKNERCSVGDEVISALSSEEPSDQTSLPKCGIRNNCRWYNQSGEKACLICRDVVTDTTI